MNNYSITDSLKGEPLQVVLVNTEQGKPILTLHQENLERILLHPEVKSRKTAIVSVAGAFRRGKSFLLNFFIRYLSTLDKSNWLGPSNVPLKGFSWRGGSERDTTGIIIWSEPFIVSTKKNEKVSILLMDTQGAFDSRSTVRDCATIFALSTLLSSVQVYNVSGNIQEDHLQHLQLFSEYGRLVSEEGFSSPAFQKLLFLVRDWSYPYEHPYGEIGGNQLLSNRLTSLEDQPEEIKNIRNHLKSCFSEINCFLMPHPGLEVANNPKFDGQLKDIHESFIENIKKLVSILLSPENIIVKIVNSREIRGGDLLHYFITYTKIYEKDELPEPRSVFQATAEADNLVCLANVKEIFIRDMENLCGPDKPYIEQQILQKESVSFKQKSLSNFDQRKKMGGPEFSKLYREKLDVELTELIKQIIENNEAKNVVGALHTPLCISGVAFVNYIIWSFFSLIGLTPIETLLQLLFYVLIFMLSIWFYSRLTGNWKEASTFIDLFARNFYSQVVKSIFVKVPTNTVNHQFGVIPQQKINSKKN